MIQCGSMDENFAAVLESLDFIKEHMATKVELAELRAEMKGEFASLRAELVTIRQRLDDVEEAIQNMRGLTKEIDYVMTQQKTLAERVSAIEEHLGIHRHAAA